MLRPASLPEEDLTTVYVKMLKDFGYPPVLRKAGAMGDSRIFSSEAGREWYGFGSPFRGMMHGQNVFRLFIRVHLALILATFVGVVSHANSFP